MKKVVKKPIYEIYILNSDGMLMTTFKNVTSYIIEEDRKYQYLTLEYNLLKLNTTYVETYTIPKEYYIIVDNGKD